MEHHEFGGDIENITLSQLEFIKNVLEQEGFRYNKVTFERVGEARDTYATNVKRIVMEGEKGMWFTESVIAKIAPSNETIRKNLDTPLMFRNEHLIYTEVLPKFLALQKEAEITERDLLTFPKCHGTNVDAPNEVIVIEDLKDSGYGLLDRLTCNTDESVRWVLRDLAKFHSLSYTLKNKEPNTYKYYKDNLLDVWGPLAVQNPEELDRYKIIEKVSLHMLDDPEHQNILQNKVTEVPIRAAKMAKYENDNQYAVIQHGDCWTNIISRFEEENMKQTILTNYQICKNCSPVNDILYLIFNCTDHKTRVNNYYNWIDYYHSELDKSLSNYGLEANYVYPRDQLDADLKRYGKLAFGSSVVLANVLTMSLEDASKLVETFETPNVDGVIDSVDFSEFDPKKYLKERLIGLVESFTLFGLL